MAGRKLNKSERSYVKRHRKAVMAEQRIREELFTTTASIDPAFGRIVTRLSR